MNFKPKNRNPSESKVDTRGNLVENSIEEKVPEIITVPDEFMTKKGGNTVQKTQEFRRKVKEVDHGSPDNNPYRNGGIGFKKWVEDYVRISIYPEGSVIPEWRYVSDFGPGYKYIWNKQCEVCNIALKMQDGLFTNRLIVFCWMRGEGKSLVVCLIQMWKFFNWPKQSIVLAANSKDQTK